MNQRKRQREIHQHGSVVQYLQRRLKDVDTIFLTCCFRSILYYNDPQTFKQNL